MASCWVKSVGSSPPFPSIDSGYCKGIGNTKKNCLRISSSFLCSATGNRTPVYGVRGRCPRPLDDSTVTVCRTSFSKASAKVLLFFDMTKYFRKKMQFFFILLQKSFFLLTSDTALAINTTTQYTSLIANSPVATFAKCRPYYRSLVIILQNRLIPSLIHYPPLCFQASLSEC